MINAAERELGTFVQRYETDNSRRGRIALVSLVTGLVTMGIAVPILINAIVDGEHVARRAGLVTGIAVAALWWAVSSGLAYLRKPGEVFKVREGGLVHQYTGHFRAVPWDQITRISDRSQPHWVGQALGWDVYCVVKLNGGGRLLITGHTRDARSLVTTIVQAVVHGIHPVPPPRRS